MVSKSIIEKLREIYQSLPKVELVDKGDGWVNQYDFLRAVGKVGINYKNLGYDHFYEFLTDSGLFSFWTDFSGEKPIRYVTYIIHSGFISGYQNRYGDNLKPPTNVYHRMTA